MNSHGTEAHPLRIDDDGVVDGEAMPIRPNTRYSISYGNGSFLATAAARDAGEVNSWIDETLAKNKRRLSRLIVGLDVERSPDYITDCDHSAAVLQLCVGRSCLVYQILHSPTIPRKLREFLGDPGYTFVGAGIRNDVQRLWEDHRLRVANVRELGPWAAEELGKKELTAAGLDVLGKEVVGEEMKKLEKLNCECERCRWDEKVLTRKQVACACLDGYFSFEIGRRLSAWY